MLPEMDAAIGEERVGSARNAQRMGEIIIHGMVEGTTRARVQRALNTITVPSGQSRNLNIGGLVDLHRVASSKGTGVWKGPATVIDMTGIELELEQSQ